MIQLLHDFCNYVNFIINETGVVIWLSFKFQLVVMVSEKSQFQTLKGNAHVDVNPGRAVGI